MMPSDCPAEDDLAGLTEGRLDAATTARLHHHVRGCEGCRLVLGALAPETTPEQDTPPEGPPSPPDAPLQPGQQVGRFVLERLVGTGGMGAVWAARDPELGRAVAVKLLRIGIGSDADKVQMRRRMLREAKSMARLAHPNVVPVFEVGEWGSRLFIVLELVEGETLGKWLSTERPLPEVIEAFLATGRGLAAAHAAGLVHRDFKPDNVLLGRDGRPRVTDFGLARADHDRESLPRGGPTLLELLKAPSQPELTPLGTLLGTPAYMAPEQLSGGRADARSDLFAFCTALYAAAAGTAPYPGRSLQELRKRVESEQLEPPKRKLPGWLRRELARGLRKDPLQRHASMNELLSALERGRGQTRRVRLGAGLGALLLAAAALLLTESRSRAPGPRRSVAVVLPPGAQPAEWLSGALSELLATELAADPHLRVVPASAVAPALTDLGLARGAAVDAALARKLERRLGVDLLVGGAVAVSDGKVRVELRLFGADARELAHVEEAAAQESLIALAGQLGTKLRGKLGDDEKVAIDRAQGSFPESAEAARLYVLGISQLRASQTGKAQLTLEQAEKLAPDNPRIEAALAEALINLNREEPAGQVTLRALRRANELPIDDRARLGILRARAMRDGKGAVELARAYYQQAPDDLERGLLLARTQEYAAHDGAATLVTIGELRKLPPPAGTDLRLDMLESTAASEVGDLRRALAAAQRGGAAAEALGARRELATARYKEGNALRRLGTNPALARQRLLEADKLYREADDLGGAAGANTMAAALLADSGDLAGARLQFEAALQTYRDLGDGVGVASILHNLAIVLRRQRLLPAAISRAREAMTQFLELGMKSGAANAMETLGNLRADVGDLPAAADALLESVRLRRELKHPLLGNSLLSLCQIRLQQGDFAAAHQLLEEVQALGATQEKKRIVDLNQVIAQLALAEGRFAEAEVAARTAAATARQVEQQDEAAINEGYLALALLAQGRLADAREAVTRGRAALAKSSTGTGRGVLAVADARVHAATDPAAALGELRAALEQARADDVASDQWEARLALAEIAPGSRSVVRGRLLSLATLARAQGFGLYGRLAETAAARKPDASRRQIAAP